MTSTRLNCVDPRPTTTTTTTTTTPTTTTPTPTTTTTTTTTRECGNVVYFSPFQGEVYRSPIPYEFSDRYQC